METNHNEPKYIRVKGARVHNLKNDKCGCPPASRSSGVAGVVRFGQIFAGTWCFVCSRVPDDIWSHFLLIQEGV